MSVQYRQYQVDAADRAFEEWKGGVKATLAILPTGTGKTVLSGIVAKRARREFNRRTLFLAHREELITQAADKLARFELETAIEMADQDARRSAALFGSPDVVIGTVQSLQKNRLTRWSPDEFGLIITDECHHARAKTYQNIYDHFRESWHLGITATPDRGDGQNLGAIYETLAFEYPLRKAIKEGYLVPLVTARLLTSVNLREIKTTGGDYNQGELELRLSPHIEELADAIKAEIGDRQSVVFTPDVGSAEAMAAALSEMGIESEAVSGKMPKNERRDALRRFEDAAFRAICCCDLLTEGWDCPRVSCVVIARPTKKRNRYAQMIGRGTRPHQDSGKTNCLVIDFAWQTTSDHELCTPVNLFDDSQTDDEVIEVAEQLLKEGKELDPERAIDEAEEIVRKRFKVKLTGKKASYKKFVFDPVGVGELVGLRLKHGWDFNPDNPASRKQLDYLKKLGVEVPDGLSRQGAGKTIDHLAKRRDAGLATVKQVGFLISLGVDPGQAREMTFKQAGETITHLLNNKDDADRKIA